MLHTTGQTSASGALCLAPKCCCSARLTSTGASRRAATAPRLRRPCCTVSCITTAKLFNHLL
jgi:hypothetical protein